MPASPFTFYCSCNVRAAQHFPRRSLGGGRRRPVVRRRDPRGAVRGDRGYARRGRLHPESHRPRASMSTAISAFSPTTGTQSGASGNSRRTRCRSASIGQHVTSAEQIVGTKRNFSCASLMPRSVVKQLQRLARSGRLAGRIVLKIQLNCL